jgi:TolA-binding protein
MNHWGKKAVRLFIIAVLMGLMGGMSCAYFNAFYNAKRYFRDGEKDYETATKNNTGNTPTQNYNKAIDASIHLLENYPNSKWVDDALLLMGKAYYRIRQWNKAERKFQELITNYPQSPLVPEGKYWAALTMKENGKRNEAITELRSLIGMELPQDLKTNVRFALADLLFEDKSYDKARLEYEKIVEKSKGKSDRSRAQYRVAECWDLAGKDSLAAEAYLKVLTYKPERKMEFDAQFHNGIVLKRLEKYDEVRNIFESLLKKDIYFEYFPQVELELADLLYHTGYIEEARSKYQRLVEVNPHTEVSARACYELGRIYLQNDRDLDKAKENFSKVKGEFAQSEYNEPAQEEIAAIDNFKAISTSRERVAAQLVTLEEVLKSMREQGEKHDSTEQNKSEAHEDSVTIKNQIDEKYHDLDSHDFRLAEYYLFDIDDLDSVVSYLSFLIKPGVSDSIRAKSLITMAAIQRDSLGNKSFADSCYRVLLSEFPGTDYENFARQQLGLPAKLTAEDSLEYEYNLADSLLWSEGDTLQALNMFKDIAKGDTASSLVEQSQYVVGWMYENMIGNKDSAKVAYRRLVDHFPLTDLTQEVKQRIEAVVVEPSAAESLKVSVPVDTGAVSPELISSKQESKEMAPTQEELPTKRRIIKK